MTDHILHNSSSNTKGCSSSLKSYQVFSSAQWHQGLQFQSCWAPYSFVTCKPPMHQAQIELSLSCNSQLLSYARSIESPAIPPEASCKSWTACPLLIAKLKIERWSQSYWKCLKVCNGRLPLAVHWSLLTLFWMLWDNLKQVEPAILKTLTVDRPIWQALHCAISL